MDLLNPIRVQFKLRRGMTTWDIFDELHGRTAGENQRERAIMFAEWTTTPYIHLDSNREVDRGAPVIEYGGQSVKPAGRSKPEGRFIPKAEVVMEYQRKRTVGPIENYALILEYSIAEQDVFDKTKEVKTAVTKPLIAKGGLVSRFYLVGINDEGTYFVRPLQDFPTSLIRNIEGILSWLNREDLKYHERIQGDIVIRFVKATEHTKQFRRGILGHITHVSYWLPKNHNNKGFTDWYALDSVRLEHRRDFGGHDIRIKGEGHLVVPHKTGFFSIEPLIVDARSFTMAHPEHGTVAINVPEGHYAALASQRGRDEITGHGVFD